MDLTENKCNTYTLNIINHSQDRDVHKWWGPLCCSEDPILLRYQFSNYSTHYKKCFQQNFNQNFRRTFCRNGPIHSKIHMKCRGPEIAIQLWGKKYKIGVLTCPDFKSFYETTQIFEKLWYWHKKGQTDKQNMTEFGYWPIDIWKTDFWQKCKMKIQWRKYSLFKNCCWNNWIPMWKNKNLDLHFAPFTNINSKRPKYKS